MLNHSIEVPQRILAPVFCYENVGRDNLAAGVASPA